MTAEGMPPEKRSFLDRHAWWMLLALMVVLAVITGPRVFVEPLWGDEMRTWRDGVEKPLSALLTWQHNPDHSPLGHLLARAGGAIFGNEHAWALRLGPWLCGLACVPAIGWMGRTLGSPAIGLLMAMMLVADPNLGYQMTQARMYAPLMLATIIALACAGSILLRPERPAVRIVGLGVALAAGIWAHSQVFAIVLAIFFVAIGCCATRRYRRAGVTLLIGVAIGLALGAQGVAKILGRRTAEAVVARDISDGPAAQLRTAFDDLSGNRPMTVIILCAFALGLVAIWRRSSHRAIAVLMGVVAVVAIANLFVAANYRPIAQARYLTVLQPGVWLAMATFVVALLGSVRWRGLGIASLAAMLVATGFGFHRQRYALQDESQAHYFRAAARSTRGAMAAGDRFVTISRGPYGFYARFYGLMTDEGVGAAFGRDMPLRITRTRLRDAARKPGPIWVLCMVTPKHYPMYAPFDDPTTAVRAIAGARGIDAGPLSELERGRRWSAVVYRIDDQQITVHGVFNRQSVPH